MDKLETARKIINEIDKEIARLFCKRMEAVKLVAEHKAEHGLPILDSGREEAVIEKNSAYVDDADLRSYYISFIKSTMPSIALSAATSSFSPVVICVRFASI